MRYPISPEVSRRCLHTWKYISSQSELIASAFWWRTVSLDTPDDLCERVPTQFVSSEV